MSVGNKNETNNEPDSTPRTETRETPTKKRDKALDYNPTLMGIAEHSSHPVYQDKFSQNTLRSIPPTNSDEEQTLEPQ